MRRTGPTKESTRKLVALLEIAGRKSKKAIWLDIAERVKAPRRQRPIVNLWKVQKLAKIFPGKHLLIPGKVLGYGQLAEKAKVIALQFSGRGVEKIRAAGGTALTIEEALQKKIPAKDIVIAK